MSGTTRQAVAPQSKQRLLGLSALGAGSVAGLLLSLAAVGSAQAQYAAGGGTATGTKSVAIGPSAVGSGFGSNALGQSAQATDTWTTAIGPFASATDTEAAAIGYNATASGILSFAGGPLSTATAHGAVAIGSGSIADGLSSSALGSASVAEGIDSVSVGHGAGQGQTSAAGSAVNIGAFAGLDSTNVQNIAIGSAAYLAGQGAGANVTGARNVAIGSGDGTLGGGTAGSNVAGNDNVAIGTDAGLGVTNDATVSVGSHSLASGTNAVAVGTGATASNAGDVALGSGAVTATAVQTATITVAGSSYDVAGTTPTSTVSVGSVGGERTITNVAAGRVSATSTDAVNGSELNATNLAVASIASGGAGMFQVYQSGSVVTPVASGLNSSAGGDGAVASGAGSTAIGYHSSSTGTNSVALGANSSDGGQSNVVSLGSPGAERRLTNVAPGINGTDGVNVNQLIGAENQWAASLSQLDQKNQAQTALALAATGLRYDDKPGAISVAAAASGYESHAGLAAGLGYTSGGGRLRYNLSATFAAPSDHADVGVVGGISYTFNH